MKLSRKLLALNLALLLMLSLLPGTALAATIKLTEGQEAHFVGPNNSDNHTFTPTVTGLYTIKLSANAAFEPFSSDATLYVLNDNSRILADISHSDAARKAISITLPLERGKTYKIQHPSFFITRNWTLSIKKTDTPTLNASAQPFYARPDSSSYFKYTPATTGKQTISAQFASSGDLVVYNSDLDRIKSAYASNRQTLDIEQSFTAGKTYYVRIEAPQYTATDGIISIKSGAGTPTTPEGTYTITFNGNGVTVPTASRTKEVTNGGKYGTLPTLTRSGYTFKGWYTAREGGTKITSTTTVNLTADRTLYAQWTKTSGTVKVTFNANGGSVSPSTRTYNRNSYYTSLPTPVRSGYTFNGWYTASSGGTRITSSSKVTTTASTQTLYAHWTRSASSTVRVTFNANGGSVSPSVRTYTRNSYYTNLPTPVRSGYTFGGWYTASSGGTRITSSTKVTTTASTQTLYAHWTRSASSTVRVTFNANGGSVSPSIRSYTRNSYYTNLPTPVRSGYTFNGWYTSSTGGTRVTSSTRVTTTASTQTLYARWTKSASATVRVIYDANGGSVSPSSQTYTRNSYYNNLPTPVYSGYTFTGWYTAKTGGTKITTSTRVTTTASTQTLYARWTKSAMFMLTFDANGGSVLQNTASVVNGGFYRSLPTPVYSGRHFAGWYTARTGGTKITPSTRVSLVGDRTLYAHWTTASVSQTRIFSGRWSVTVPAGWQLALYSSSTGISASDYRSESLQSYTIACTQAASLSNGTTRFYGQIGGRGFWFTYTAEMDVN